MPRRTIGVELGSDAIRLVRIAGGWRQFQVDGWQVRPLPPAHQVDHRSAAVQALRELAAAGWFKADQVVLSLPGDQVASRVVTVPFREVQKIRQILAYEVESLLPFELDEVVVGSAAIHPLETRSETGARPSGGGSRVLAVALTKARLRQVLELLEEAGVDPSAIEIGPIGLARFARALLPAPAADAGGPALAVIELGQSGTTVAFCRNGQLAQFRTISRRAGHSQADDDALVAELKRATHFYELDERSAVEQLILCGPRAAESAALAGRLGEQLGAQPLAVEAAWLRPGGAEEGALLPFAQAIGAALRPPDDPCNFRQAEFVSPRERTRARTRSVGLAAAIAVLAVLGAANLFAHYYVKEQAYQTLKADQRELFAEAFSDVRVVVNELEQAKGAMEALSRRAAFLGEGEPSALLVLDRLTAGLELLPELKVERLHIVGHVVRFEGEVASFEAVDRVRELLRQVPSSTQVTISDARMSADQEHVRFRAELLFSSDHAAPAGSQSAAGRPPTAGGAEAKG
ncbi:MAG: pilus assembly protein PilM [Nitrospirota bacterium]